MNPTDQLGFISYYTIATAVECNIQVVKGFLSLTCTDEDGISSLLHCLKRHINTAG